MTLITGFSDIFGDTLEQPEKPAAKPPKPERRLSVSLEKLPNLTSPTPSFNKQDVMSESEMSAVSDRNITPDLDESNPTVKVGVLFVCVAACFEFLIFYFTFISCVIL